MSMRIGKVGDKIVKRVRLNSDGTTQVQPVRGDTVQGRKTWVNDGPQYSVKRGEFKKQWIAI